MEPMNNSTLPPTTDTTRELLQMTLIVILVLVSVVAIATVCTIRQKRKKQLSKVHSGKPKYKVSAVPDLEMSELLGVSQYSLALIYRGQFARKTVTISELSFDPLFFPKKNASKVQSAILALSNITYHPHVVNLIHAGFHESGFSLVNEHCALGSLFNVIHHDHIALSFGLRLRLFEQALQAVSYMHSHLVILSPLTSKSVFLDDKWNCKVRIPHEELRVGSKFRANTDNLAEDKVKTYLQKNFTAAKEKKGIHVTELEYYEVQYVSNKEWVNLTTPPEGSNRSAISTATDVYYLGTILYELLAQEQPFPVLQGENRYDTFYKVKRSALYTSLVEQNCDYVDAVKVLGLLDACWKPLPEQRCTTSHLLSEISGLMSSYDAAPPKGELNARNMSVKQLIKMPWEINFESIEIDVLLGTGRFGSVYRGKWHGTNVAVKTLPVIAGFADSDKGFLDTLHINNVLEEIVREINLTCDLRHPHILSFFGACTRLENLCIVQELAPLGSVEDMLRKSNHNLTYADIVRFSRGAAAGLVYLHTLDIPIYHRDLTPRNLLVFNNMEVKLADFALSTFQNKPQAKVHSNLAFTAPEVFLSKKVTATVDVYSLGCVLYNLYSLSVPFQRFPESNDLDWMKETVAEQQFRPQLPLKGTWKPADVEVLIKECWNQDPKHRPHIKEILLRLIEMEKVAENSKVVPLDPKTVANIIDPQGNVKVADPPKKRKSIVPDVENQRRSSLSIRALSKLGSVRGMLEGHSFRDLNSSNKSKKSKGSARKPSVE